MGDWHSVETQDDIDLLLDTYGGFHDSCIVSCNYQSGTHVNDKRAMSFGCAEDHNLSVIFQSQWGPKTLELQFIGLRQMHLTGWQYNYLDDIFGAYLSFHNDLLPGEPNRVIVWTDSGSFDIEKFNNAIHEPSETYIVANTLMWRIVE